MFSQTRQDKLAIFALLFNDLMHCHSMLLV